MLSYERERYVRYGLTGVTEGRHNTVSAADGLATSARAGALHVFYPERLKPIYDKFDVDTNTSARLNVIYHVEPGYTDVAEKIRACGEPLVGEVSLTMAAQLIGKFRNTPDEMVIIGSPTSFARGKETAAVFYRPGKLGEVQTLEIADTYSANTWMALMLLISQGAPITRDPSRLRKKLRVVDYEPMFDRVEAALLTDAWKSLECFVAAGRTTKFSRLLELSEDKFERTDLFTWYFAEVSQITSATLTLHSRLAIARKRDCDAHHNLYGNYIDLWQRWKSVATQADQQFHVLTPNVSVSDAESELACEFLNIAQETLGREILDSLGFGAYG